MPAQGQHPKRRLTRLSRICVVAATGGAALALPLVGAVHASAAEPAKPAPAAAPAHEHPAAPKAAKYRVVHGDTLAKIADSHQVSGGWHRLYTDNKSVIGSDPNLIHPGQVLTLHGAAAKPAAPRHAAAAKPKPAAPAPAPAAAEPAAFVAKPAAAVRSVDTGWTKPVDGPLGTPYHQAGANWSSGYHTGVDFVVWTGTDVHSVAAGTVVTAGWGGAYGNNVVIKHLDGKYTLYAHLSQLLVSAGQNVTEGQRVGLSGATGNVTGPHLHFEVRTTPYYGSDVDPVAYLGAHGVTL